MAGKAGRAPIGTVDVILAVVLVVFALLGTGPAGADQPDALRPNVWAYVLAAGSGAVVVGWRRWPLLVFVATGAAIAVFLAWGFPYGPILFSGALAAGGLAAFCPLRLVLAACTIDAAAMTLAIVIRAAAAGSLGWSTLVTDVTWLLVWVGLPAAVGIAVRTRREATVRVQEEQARRAVSEERLRMAQEVHDVVGHGLAVIAMQASAGLHVLDRHPEKVRQVLEAIQATSRESLEGLRAELATLRGQSGENSSRRPHAGLRDIPLLVERVRAGGLDVRLEAEPLKSPPPQAVDVAAYRIVQEAVTNVLRHAGPSATARVRVREVRGQLLIEVSDTGEGLPMDAVLDGSGVAGMRDRAHRVGGSVDVVRRPSGGVRVTALLPLTTESVIGSATGSLPDSATDLPTGSPEVQP